MAVFVRQAKKSDRNNVVAIRRGFTIEFKMNQDAKKVTFTACHSGKLKLTFTCPNIISTSPKNVLMSRLISQFLCNLDSWKNSTCPLGKLITEFTSPIGKPTCPGLSDTTFFAHCELKSRLRVVPHFPSGIVEWAKCKRAWKSPHVRNARCDGLPFLRGVSSALLSLRLKEGLFVVYKLEEKFKVAWTFLQRGQEAIFPLTWKTVKT